MSRIETTILRSLLTDDTYTRKVLPFLDASYFADASERNLFLNIKAFVDRYNNLPTKEALVVDLNRCATLSQTEFDGTLECLTSLTADTVESPNPKWLLDHTETWCRERAIHNAMVEAINILDGNDDKRSPGSVPKLLQDALAVSFDPHVGHDYLEDAQERFNFYHLEEERIPFHLERFNRVTKNGVPRQTLNVIIAGVNVGKSLVLCDLAGHYMQQGQNVLYITLEMAEERIAERIDARMLDTPLDTLKNIKESVFLSKVDQIRQKHTGKLVIKQFPTGGAHVGHFRFLLDELALKKKFKPDVIIVDYLNIAVSQRLKMGNGGSYELVKAVAEEFRALACEQDVPLWTATQMNRAGYNNTDPDMTNTSECIWVDETVKLASGQVLRVGDLKEGMRLLSHGRSVQVQHVYDVLRKDCVRITLKSGKSIVVSKEHAFPTRCGKRSINDGLSVGDFLASVA